MGLYFSWGNVDGHAEGSGYNFSEVVYNETPGAAISGDIPLGNDAARANLGGAWRMPTEDECQELIDNCTCVWTTRNGVYGSLFVSNINRNALFIPMTGYYNGQNLLGDNAGGWLSTWEDVSLAYRFRGNSVDVQILHGQRYLGYNIRAVMNPT